MYLRFKDMLDEYSVEVKVYPPAKSKSKFHYVGGIKIEDSDEEATPEIRNDPVLPLNSQNSIMSQYLPGGVEGQTELLWLSTGEYPKNTIVEVPSQGGKFRVTNYSNYRAYSDVIIYELKGDDKHPNGK